MTRFGAIALLGLCLLPAFAEQPVPRRYTFAKDTVFPYRMEIRGEKGDLTEAFTARPEIRVAGFTDPGVARLMIQNTGLNVQMVPKAEQQAGPLVPFGPVRPFPHPTLAFPFPGSRTHELSVDDRGRIIREKGAVALPYALGTFASLLLEPLPEQDAATWTRTERSWLTVGRDSGAFGARLLEPLASPFGRGPEERENLACEEKFTFTRGESGKNGNEGRREHSLKTLEKVAGEPRFELELSGSQVADPKTGLPTELKLKGSLTSRNQNITARVPILVAVHLVSESEIAKMREDQAKAARDAKAKAEEEARKRKEPFSKAEREAIISDLSSSENRKVREALRILDKREPEKPDSAISAKLATILGASDRFLAMQAAKALEHHATEAETGALLKALETNDVLVAQYCMKALARTKAKKAPGVLVSKLANISLRHPASEALKAMGPMAEEPVSGLLKSEDWNLRMTACEILAVIGTDKSAKVLKKLAESDENTLVKHKAGEALDAMARRK